VQHNAILWITSSLAKLALKISQCMQYDYSGSCGVCNYCLDAGRMGYVVCLMPNYACFFKEIVI
jgi:recombinational DNA repair protein RecR